MLETGPVSGRSQDEPPPIPSRVEEVLAQALARLGRSAGVDAARGPAYDPDGLIPGSFTGTGSLLDWEHTVAACRQWKAPADCHKSADLAISRHHVAVMTAGSAEATQSPRWQNSKITSEQSLARWESTAAAN